MRTDFAHHAQRGQHTHSATSNGRAGKPPVWPHVVMALFGAGWAVAFEVGVRLYGAEVVALAGLVIVPWFATLKLYPIARHVLLAYAVWVMAIMIADSVNGTAVFDSARNMATPILGGLSLLFVLATLSRNPNALLTFLAATVIAKGLLGEASYGYAFIDMALSWDSISKDTNFFKVRIDPFLTPAVVLAACLLSRNNLFWAATVLGVACVGYFALDSRAVGLMFFLSATALFAIHFRFRLKPGRIIVGGMAAIITGYGAYIAYVNYTMTHNPNGHNGKQLARMENPYDPFELLVQGRSEWLVMTTAIAERPLFGWGSWARDTDYRFANLRADRTGNFTYGRLEGANHLGYVPAHSIVGSAWVWSGVLGFAAVAWLFRQLIRMAARLFYIQSFLTPAAFFFVTMLVWHFFFSPPQHVRLTFPVALASLIVLTSSPRRSHPTLNHISIDFERNFYLRATRL